VERCLIQEMKSSLASSLTSSMFSCWGVVSVERCLIQEMKSSLASSPTSSMPMTDQRL